MIPIELIGTPDCPDCKLLGEECATCGVLTRGMPENRGREGDCVCGCSGAVHLDFSGWCLNASVCGCEEHQPRRQEGGA